MMINKTLVRKPYDFQKEALKYSQSVYHPAYFIAPRLGKTFITIRDLKYHFKEIGPILIIAPYSALYGWEKELLSEGFVQSEIIYLTGDKDNKSELITHHGTFFLANKEIYLSFPEVANYNWQAVISDEATYLKCAPSVNWSKKYGKRSNISKFYSESFRKVKRRYVLTGTPMTESELDYYMILRFLDPAILGYSNIYAFKNDNFILLPTHNYSISRKGKDFLAERLSKYCFFLSRQELGLGGKQIFQTRKVRISSKTRKVYNTMMRDFLLILDDKIIDATNYIIESVSWARQLFGGFVNDQFVFDHKIKEIEELLSGEFFGQQVIIWSEFVNEINLLKSTLDRMKISSDIINGSVLPLDRVDIYKRFNKKEYQVLIANPRCLQYGVDLYAGRTMIFYSSPLGLETRLQAQERNITMHTESSLIIDIVCDDTIEEDFLLSLQNKESKRQLIQRLIYKLRKVKI